MKLLSSSHAANFAKLNVLMLICTVGVTAFSLPGVSAEVITSSRQEQASDTAVTKLESSCGGIIFPESGVFLIPTGWCFQRSLTVPKSKNYVLTFSARSLDQDGYGVWLRGVWNGSNTRAIAVQYEVAPFGNPSLHQIIFRKYPATEASINVAAQIILDRKYHAWRIVGSENQVQFFLDGKLIGSFDEPASGFDFGFRTWRGSVEVKDFKVSEP